MVCSGERRLRRSSAHIFDPCSDEAGFAEDEAHHYRCPPANRPLAGAEDANSGAKKKASPESFQGWPSFAFPSIISAFVVEFADVQVQKLSDEDILDL